MRRAAPAAVLAAALVLFGACENAPDGPGQTTTLAPVDGPDLNLTGCWQPTPQSIIDDLDWEVFEGTISPGLGGFLYAQSATWGSGVYFSIQVPPDALPAAAGATDFSLRIPTKASYLAYQSENCNQGLPLIMQMEPSGLNFLVDVTVHATYMPWMIQPGMTWEHWTSYPTFGDYELESVQEHWYKGALQNVTLSYKAPHFSRWETGGGDGDPPDGGNIPEE